MWSLVEVQRIKEIIYTKKCKETGLKKNSDMWHDYSVSVGEKAEY